MMSCATAVMYQPYSPYNTSSNSSSTFSPERLSSSGLPPEDNNNQTALENKLVAAQIEDYSRVNSHHNPHHAPSTQSSPSRPQSHDEDSSDSSSISAHRLSSNIVVFTHYVGDASSIVEKHFSRALSAYKPEDTSCKPMSARNLPASFWTAPSELMASSPRSSSTTSSNTHLISPNTHTSSSSYSDLYPESITGALHQLAADWQYHPPSAMAPSIGHHHHQQPIHHHPHHHPSSSPYPANYANYAASPRFNPSNYWGPPPSRLVGSSSSSSNSSSVKSEWSPEPPYADFAHPHHPYYSNIAAVAAAGLDPNLDPSLVNPKSAGGAQPVPSPASAADLFWTATSSF
eukprot:TRINITY_DN536_c0_g2_i1.p1 TRINITY_DN536_c0_g2~~TRINITY_DN536_c0_g2_i1.p1  ORF type:complete len:345 (-),score=105.90 TRINITY_DN536_c0_g2_i1:346-1380(-)